MMRSSKAVRIQQGVTLDDHTTLRVGGPAKFYTEVKATDDLASAIEWARSRSVPFFILGGGSNIVVADQGFDGLAIKIAIAGVDVQVEKNAAILTAGAGEFWDDLVACSVASGYAGIECLSGIPGLVGATPIQNVGAYGQEVSQTITRVEAFDTLSGKTIHLDSSECGFGYRTSRFKAIEPGRFVITRVTYQLTPGPPSAIAYPEVERRLALISPTPSLSDIRAAVLSIRRSKGMVMDDADPDTRSVGSFFVNPVVTAGDVREVRSRAGAMGFDAESMPVFNPGDDKSKLSAAWLIERSGFARGYARAGAGISTKHSLAITNRGGATAKEILALATEIRETVLDRFGVKLEPEPVLIGFGSLNSQRTS
ncbi:MAG TPA: UDP-N-acetylmuramate dehydrogenase [Blastocatellia bacterium]